MPEVTVVWLAGLQACDGTDGLSDVRTLGWVARAAGTVVGGDGRRTAGAPTGGCGAAPPAPRTEAGLGRPGDARRPGPAAPQAAAGESAGDPGHAAALAPAAGRLAVDVPLSSRSAAGRRCGRVAD